MRGSSTATEVLTWPWETALDDAEGNDCVYCAIEAVYALVGKVVPSAKGFTA